MSVEHEIINVDMYQKKIRALKIKPKTIIPKYIKTILATNKINDLENDNEKARLFIMLLFKRKLKGSTIKRYYNIFKPTLFPTTTIIPNSMVFDKASDAKPQMRGSNFNQVEKLIDYVENLDDSINYKWVILLALYTGLRSHEALQLKTSNLIQLSKQNKTVDIIRKNNNIWKVLYYDEFLKFLELLLDNYKKEMNFYIENSVDINIFNFTSQALHYKLKEYYSHANKGSIAPMGFGLHIFRYFIASKLATKKLDVAQIFLAHKNIKTTEKYIRYNDSQKELELNEINKKNDLYKNINEQLTSNVKVRTLNNINYDFDL